MKKEKIGISFLKKFYYSMFKISKYGELTKEGLGKSIKYIIDLLFILATIYSIVMVWQTKKSLNNLKEYLEKNMPNIYYENNELTAETDQRVVLDDKLITINFKGQIVIDTVNEYDEVIKEYQEKMEPTIILTKDYYTTVNENGTTSQYTYDEILSKYFNNNIESLDKEELLYLFDNFSYFYYFFSYLLSYAIAHSLLVIGYCLLLTIIYFVVYKIKKADIKFFETYSFGLYAMTMTILIYFAISFMTFNSDYIVRLASLLIPIWYMGRAIFINKWITPDMVRKR